jgi:hypothetical protein
MTAAQAAELTKKDNKETPAKDKTAAVKDEK